MSLKSSRRIGTDVPWILLWCPPTTTWTLHLFSIVMCTIGVKYQHVDRVSLKHSILKEKGVLIWQMHKTDNDTRKMQFFYPCSAQNYPLPEKGSWLFPELADARKKRAKAKNVVGHSPYFKNSGVPIILRPNSPAFPLSSLIYMQNKIN